MHVLVKDNLIETISDEPLAVIQTDNVTIVDGGGRTLMPGMIEGHGHVMFASDLNRFLNQDEFEQGVNAARRANDYLMNGFTNIKQDINESRGIQENEKIISHVTIDALFSGAIRSSELGVTRAATRRNIYIETLSNN